MGGQRAPVAAEARLEPGEPPGRGRPLPLLRREASGSARGRLSAAGSAGQALQLGNAGPT